MQGAGLADSAVICTTSGMWLSESMSTRFSSLPQKKTTPDRRGLSAISPNSICRPAVSRQISTSSCRQGNVVAFLAPSTRQAVLSGFARHLAPSGRVVIGFGAGRGYEFPEFLADATASGLEADLLLSTWDLRPFKEDSEFLVAVFSRA